MNFTRGTCLNILLPVVFGVLQFLRLRRLRNIRYFFFDYVRFQCCCLCETYPLAIRCFWCKVRLARQKPDDVYSMTVLSTRPLRLHASCMDRVIASSQRDVAACDLYYDDVSSISERRGVHLYGWLESSNRIPHWLETALCVCVWSWPRARARTHACVGARISLFCLGTVRCYTTCLACWRRTDRINRRTSWSVWRNFVPMPHVLFIN